MSGIILLRGGGDLASGAALRLFRTGVRLVITELANPLAVRRTVSFSQAVYSEQTIVEGVTARLAQDVNHALQLLHDGALPVLVDPQVVSRNYLVPVVLIDGRMIKRPPDLGKDAAQLVIGLGPGFIAGVNCHAVIETRRGPNLGRVIWDGPAEADTGFPDPLIDPRQGVEAPDPRQTLVRVRKPQGVEAPDPRQGVEAPDPRQTLVRVRKPQGVEAPDPRQTLVRVRKPQGVEAPDPRQGVEAPEREGERVLRAPADGVLRTQAQIGEHIAAGQVVAVVAGQPVIAAFAGVLRGLLIDGFQVSKGLKIGDIDPRDDPLLCQFVSDKSLAVGGGVLEAILSRADIRSQLWDFHC